MEYITTSESCTRTGQGGIEDGTVNPVTQFEISRQELDEAAKELLQESKKEFEYEDVVAGAINWLDDEFYDSWDKVKGHWHKIVKPSQEDEFQMTENPKIEKWFFLAHQNDMIMGKPQLVHDTMQKIPLIRLTSKLHKKGSGENKEEWKTAKYLFFDERYDKRYDGAMLDTFALDFWVYKLKFEGKEYYVYSQERLEETKCRIKGMIIEMNDVSEMTKTLKINSLSRIFIADSSEPAVKTLDKKSLVELVKKRGVNLQGWLTHLSQHPFGTINNFPIEAENLRSSFLLAGKIDGWPPHLVVMGKQGSRKTMGHGETIYSKFDEEVKMASATQYRLKGLIPSFKKMPAEPGYLLQCNRIAVVDEIGKLVDAESNRHDRQAKNIMGEFNDILEFKHRSGGSGNDFIDICPTAKVFMITNPCSNHPTIYSHVGLIDPTTMSRVIWWVQDDLENEFVMSPNGLIRNPPETLPSPQNPPYTMTSLFERVIENRKKEIVLKKSRGGVLTKEEFLTIYDSCNAFVCEIEDAEVETIAGEITALAKEPMKGVWKPRSYHHVKLLIDGLCKMRCLFDEKSVDFKAKEIDYKWARAILLRMVKAWDTDLSPKEDIR